MDVKSQPDVLAVARQLHIHGAETGDDAAGAEEPLRHHRLDGEYYCKLSAETGRLPLACLRYFNVCGPRQDPKSQSATAAPRRSCRNQSGLRPGC